MRILIYIANLVENSHSLVIECGDMSMFRVHLVWITFSFVFANGLNTLYACGVMCI